jgi:hypothetical protein
MTKLTKSLSSGCLEFDDWNFPEAWMLEFGILFL